MLESINHSYLSQARKKGIKLSWHCNTQSRPVYADQDKIIQIFNNLINNALRFTNSGGSISIHAKNKEKFLEFQVRDTGIGISKLGTSKAVGIGAYAFALSMLDKI